MPLTDTQVRLATGREKPYKLADKDGLFLLVKPSDARYWRYKYRRDDKEFSASFGVYPAVGLKDARNKLEICKEQLGTGETPAPRRPERS